MILPAVSSLPPPLLAAPMENTAPTPLLALTTALGRGDDPAWAEFHRDYGPGLFRQLLAATRGDHDLASEALQQTYLRVARYVRPCDAAPQFGSWLRVVARTSLSDCRRRRGSFWQMLRRRAVEPDDERAADAAEEQLQTALDRALGRLSADQRALLEAKYFSGADVRGLAAQLAISPKAVESRLTRARAELRQLVLRELSTDA